MEQPIKCDVNILKVLKNADIKQIDYLVDVLTDNGRGRVALSSSIKDLLLFQKAERDYTEQGLRYLLHEFQGFGGHSVVNLFRSEPLPYSTLLTDVHIKLNGVDSKKKSDNQKEREIVLSLFGNEWESLGDHERWERCTETKVIAGFFRMQDNLKFDTNGVVFGLSSAASAAAFVALRMLPATALAGYFGVVGQSLSEAYRVTIPFVAHIAMLKMLQSPKINQYKI